MKIYNYFKNIAEENISQEFRLRNIDETRKHFFEEIKQNELMSKKHKKVCTTLNYIQHFLILASTIIGCVSIFAFASNYIEHFLILASTIIGCVSIFAFASPVGIPIGITSTAMELKICTITAGIKKYKSIIKKNKKKHDKIVLLEKSKLNSREILISKALIDSVIIHDEFVLINNV